tara:strand:+ start:26961 stop:27494 length:534 start_codon:yes stop_codon:yes gene_type:complete
MKSILIAVAIAMAVTACASNPSAEQAYYQAAAAEQGRPLVELVAEPGQAITGLQSLRVYAPQTGGGVRQYQKQYHPAWGIAASAVQIGLPIYLGGKAAVDLADSVGKHVGAVARDVVVVEQPDPTIVQTPDPVIVQQPGPVIVQQPPPLVVDQPPPIIVDPVVIEQPDPIIINQPSP